MIAYAVAEKTVCGRPMESGTKALVATPAGHSRIHTRCKRARQRIPGIRHFAQRKRRGSVAGDTQTFAALVAGNAGNTICTADKEFEVAADDANVAVGRDSNCLCRRLEPLWAPICPPTRLITQNGYHWFTVYFHASLSDAIRERTYTSTCKPAGIAPADLVDLAAFRRLGARSMIAVPLLNRMKMADGAFDWDGYALVGIAPGLYKKETGGRRGGSCAVRWQSVQENFPATCWRRIQVWVRRDSKAKADWRQRGP